MRYPAQLGSFFALSILSVSLLADGPPQAANAAPTQDGSATAGPVVPPPQPCFQASPGGFVLLRDGTSSEFGKTITLKDGTTVAPDGRILRPDGTAVKLAVGEWLNVDGVVCSPAHPAPVASVTSAAGVLSFQGTKSVSQAGLDLGLAEAERRTKAAIDEAVATAPGHPAK
jgi:hypothetical protein